MVMKLALVGIELQHRGEDKLAMAVWKEAGIVDKMLGKYLYYIVEPFGGAVGKLLGPYLEHSMTGLFDPSVTLSKTDWAKAWAASAPSFMAGLLQTMGSLAAHPLMNIKAGFQALKMMLQNPGATLDMAKMAVTHGRNPVGLSVLANFLGSAAGALLLAGLVYKLLKVAAPHAAKAWQRITRQINAGKDPEEVTVKEVSKMKKKDVMLMGGAFGLAMAAVKGK